MSLNVLNPGSSFRYLHSLAKHRTGAASRRLTVRKWYYFGQAGPFVSNSHCGSPTFSIAHTQCPLPLFTYNKWRIDQSFVNINSCDSWKYDQHLYIFVSCVFFSYWSIIRKTFNTSYILCCVCTCGYKLSIYLALDVIKVTADELFYEKM